MSITQLACLDCCYHCCRCSCNYRPVVQVSTPCPPVSYQTREYLLCDIIVLQPINLLQKPRGNGNTDTEQIDMAMQNVYHQRSVRFSGSWYSNPAFHLSVCLLVTQVCMFSLYVDRRRNGLGQEPVSRLSNETNRETAWKDTKQWLPDITDAKTMTTRTPLEFYCRSS